jgi:hypothetical protein
MNSETYERKLLCDTLTYVHGIILKTDENFVQPDQSSWILDTNSNPTPR